MLTIRSKCALVNCTTAYVNRLEINLGKDMILYIPNGVFLKKTHGILVQDTTSMIMNVWRYCFSRLLTFSWEGALSLLMKYISSRQVLFLFITVNASYLAGSVAFDGSLLEEMSITLRKPNEMTIYIFMDLDHAERQDKSYFSRRHFLPFSTLILLFGYWKIEYLFSRKAVSFDSHRRRAWSTRYLEFIQITHSCFPIQDKGKNWRIIKDYLRYQVNRLLLMRHQSRGDTNVTFLSVAF